MARIQRNLKPRLPKGDMVAADENELAGEEDYFAGGFGVPVFEDDDKPASRPTPIQPIKGGKILQPAKKIVAAKASDLKAIDAKFKGRKIVTLGTPINTKGMTKKSKAVLEDWRGKNHGKMLDALIKGHIQAARTKFGHRGVYHGSDTKDLVLGIPIPALAFEFVLANDVFPLGLILHLVAKHGSYKSALVAEFMRWFDLAGGINVLDENETKFNPEWYESIMGSTAFERMQYNKCDSVESWQKHVTFDTEGFKKLLEGTKENPGPGRTVPVLQAVDSIMGKVSIETEKKIQKEGSAGRGFPLEALSISRYMATVPQWLDGWPFALVLVNHLKIQKDEDSGDEVRKTGGGVRVNFQESYELEMQKVGAKVLECTEWSGNVVEIRCEKNSFGPTHRACRVRVLWWEEPDPDNDGNFLQKTVWDWDWALCNLLWNILEGDRNVRLRAILKQAGFRMSFKSPTAITPLATCETMGIKEELSWSEMGAEIRKRPEIVALLRKALRIKPRSVLAGDYLQQMNDMAEDLP